VANPPATGNRRTKDRVRQIALAIGFAVVGGGWLLSFVVPDQIFELGFIGMFVGPAIAGTLIFQGAHVHPDREALAWRLIGVGFLLAAFGLGLTIVLDLLFGIPVFGPTDLIFLSAYGIAITGFLLVPHAGAGFQSKIRVFLDGLIGAVAIATIIGIYFLPGIRARIDGATAWERIAGVGYPLLDSLMVIVALIVTIRRSAWRFDIRIAAIGMAMVVQAFADLRLLNSGIGATLTEARPDFRIFLLAVLFQLLTASQIRKRMAPREYAERRQPLWAMVAPYGAAIVAVVATTREAILSGISPQVASLLSAALGLVALVVVRQVVALREYRAIVSQQRQGLVASVSHELRTPLTAMVGFLEVLQDPELNLNAEERLEMTGIVRHQALYMSRIVADLLLLAKETQVLKETDVPLGLLMTTSMQTLNRDDRTLETSVEPGLVALIDRDRVQQALDNLIVNAFRYGGGAVKALAKSDGDDLVIEVHDNGPGVPRKYELAIWEQFERGANKLNSNTPGSGIGLSVVDLVVRRHGGAAVYERSTLLGGSCFRMTFPGRVRPAVSPQSAPSPTVASHLAS
jgi:signal transduction histidine kinase